MRCGGIPPEPERRPAARQRGAMAALSRGIQAWQYCELRHRLEQLIELESDSLRFYLLGNHYENKIVHIGAKQTYTPEEPLMI